MKKFIIIISLLINLNIFSSQKLRHIIPGHLAGLALFGSIGPLTDRLPIAEENFLSNFIGVSKRIKENTLKINEYIKKNIIEKYIEKYISIKDLKEHIFKKVDEKVELIKQTYNSKQYKIAEENKDDIIQNLVKDIGEKSGIL